MMKKSVKEEMVIRRVVGVERVGYCWDRESRRGGRGIREEVNGVSG